MNPHGMRPHDRPRPAPRQEGTALPGALSGFGGVYGVVLAITLIAAGVMQVTAQT